MSQRRSRAIAAAAAVLVLAASSCGNGTGPSESDPIDTSGPGFLQPGTEFWDGWTVPVETVLIGSAFPRKPRSDEAMPDNPEPVGAAFLVSGDPHAVLRDVFAQLDAHGLRAVLPDYQTEVCGGGGEELHCTVYGQGADGYTKASVMLTVEAPGEQAERYPQLILEFGTYAWLDVSYDHGPADIVEPEMMDWSDAEAPQGEASVEITVPREDGLTAGSTMPFFGMDEPVGKVPEGARLLAPPYNPSPTYGFSGVFAIEDESAIGELAAMAEEAATGDKLADMDLAAGDLRSHHVSYDGSAGGCSVDFDTMTSAGGAVFARLHIGCD